MDDTAHQVGETAHDVDDTTHQTDDTAHPGLGSTSGAYAGPNTGNLWFDSLADIPGYHAGVAEGKKLPIPEPQYEYLDHTADVQIHSWGKNLKAAFEHAAVALHGYMTEDVSKIEMKDMHVIEARAQDLESLLFHFLDECLFIFAAQPFFIARKFHITRFDEDNFHIKATAFGEQFDLAKHTAGTEIKAITYSAMQILQKELGDENMKHKVEIYVIVDI